MPGVMTLLSLFLLGQSGLSALAETEFRAGVAKLGQVQESRRHFARAAELFGQMPAVPAVYLNLGKAELLAGRPERALWALESGLLLEPGSRVLRQHRDHVRTQIQYPPGGLAHPETDAWPAWLFRPTLRSALSAALACYVAACGLFTTWLQRRRRALLSATAVMAALALASLLVLTWLALQACSERAHPRLIVAVDTPLYRGNGPSYPAHPDLPVLPPGVEARLLLRRGGWLQVRCASGIVGWLPADAALIVDAGPLLQ